MYGNLSSHTHSEKGHLDRAQVLCHCRYLLCVSCAYASVILASPCVRPPITFNHLKRVQSRLQQKPSFRLMAQNNDTSGCPMLGPRPIKQTRTHCQHARHKLQPKAPSRTPLLPCVSFRDSVQSLHLLLMLQVCGKYCSCTQKRIQGH